MYFNVYFDPQVISVANAAGDLGLQSLTAILRGFLQNCFIAEFDEYLIQPEIQAELELLPATSDRSTLMKIIKKMVLDNRFVYCLKMGGNVDSLSALLVPANRELVDLILVGQGDGDLSGMADTETATLATYQNSYFEDMRSKFASEGITLEQLSMGSSDFLNNHLRRALQHAQRIDIIDKLLLRKYKSNFKYSLGILFDWLNQNLRDPSNCKLVFHSTYKDDDEGNDNLAELHSDLQSLKTGNLTKLLIDLEIYDGDYNYSLPHDRFILTDQIAIGIPRGMDIFVREDSTTMIRDVTLDCKNKKEIDDLLTTYSGFILPNKKIQVV